MAVESEPARLAETQQDAETGEAPQDGGAAADALAELVGERRPAEGDEKVDHRAPGRRAPGALALEIRVAGGELERRGVAFAARSGFVPGEGALLDRLHEDRFDPGIVELLLDLRDPHLAALEEQSPAGLDRGPRDAGPAPPGR